MPGLRSRKNQRKDREADIKDAIKEAVQSDDARSGKKKPEITYAGGGDKMTVRGKSITTFVPPEQAGMWPGEAE